MAPRRPTNPNMKVLEDIDASMGEGTAHAHRETTIETSPIPTWFRLIREFGFPMIVAAGLAWAFVGYNKQVREDQAKERQNIAEIVEKLNRRAEDDRKELSSKLDRMLPLLEQIKDELRSRNKENRR